MAISRTSVFDRSRRYDEVDPPKLTPFRIGLFLADSASIQYVTDDPKHAPHVAVDVESVLVQGEVGHQEDEKTQGRIYLQDHGEGLVYWWEELAVAVPPPYRGEAVDVLRWMAAELDEHYEDYFDHRKGAANEVCQQLRKAKEQLLEAVRLLQEDP